MEEISKPSNRRTRILLVDDEVSIRESISDFLTLNDYAVESAANGRQALEFMQYQTPDLIISDIMMPDMDGYAFLDAVRRNQVWASIPFIFLTARGQHKDVRRGLGLGVDDYLSKPFELDELLDAIQARLKRVQEIRQATLSEIERVKGQLLTVFSHELRTPLTYIYGYVSLLEDQAETLNDDYFNMALNGLQKGTDRLTRLVEDLMLLVRVDSGVAAAEVERRHLAVDMAHIMQPVLEKLQARAEAAQIKLHVEYPGALTLDCVPTYIEEVMKRLGGNAIKFNQPDGNVWIRIQPQDDDVLFVIEDDGVGIEPAELERVFTRFEQIDREKTEQQGLGLGLTISRGLVKAHHGKIWLESTPGEGTTVSFQIPALQPLPSDDAQGQRRGYSPIL